MPKYRESCTADIATAIADFPTISNRELFRYLAWKGHIVSYSSVVGMASQARTALNANLRGPKRRIHLTPDGKRAVRKIRKFQ